MTNNVIPILGENHVRGSPLKLEGFTPEQNYSDPTEAPTYLGWKSTEQPPIPDGRLLQR